MICIDGNIYGLTRELDEYVDYWIIQSYGSSNPGLMVMALILRK